MDARTDPDRRHIGSPTSPLILAADIGGTYVRIGATNRDGAIAEREKLSTDLLRVDDPVKALSDMIRGYIGKLPERPDGIVVGVPAFMDKAKRTVIKASNVETLNGLSLANLLSHAFNLPVWLEHDVTLRMRGEYARGAAKGFDLALGVFFGTGVGASFLKRGEPWKGGAYGMELGHVSMRGEGRRCGCGGLDCVETYSSGRVLQDIARHLKTPIEQIFTRRSALRELDAALTRFIEDQAIAVATAVTLLDPEIVVLGGGVILDTAGYPIDEMTNAIRRHISPAHEISRLSIAKAQLGWPAVLYGAVSIADEQGFS